MASRKSRSSARSSLGDLALAPMVMAMRIPVLAAEAANGKLAKRESSRAVNEKILAGFEGMLDAQACFMRAAFEFWPAVLAGKHPAQVAAEDLHRIGKAAMAPASNRVRSNFDRLKPRL